MFSSPKSSSPRFSSPRFSHQSSTLARFSRNVYKSRMASSGMSGMSIGPPTSRRASTPSANQPTRESSDKRIKRQVNQMASESIGKNKQQENQTIRLKRIKGQADRKAFHFRASVQSWNNNRQVLPWNFETIRYPEHRLGIH